MGEPIEVRLLDSFGNSSTYVGHLTDAGILRHSLVTRSGIPESLSNIQPKLDLPMKAVAGWQAEMVRYFESGIREIVQVR